MFEIKQSEPIEIFENRRASQPMEREAEALAHQPQPWIESSQPKTDAYILNANNCSNESWARHPASNGTQERQNRKWLTNALTTDNKYMGIMLYLREQRHCNLQELLPAEVTDLYHHHKVEQTFHIPIGNKEVDVRTGRIAVRVKNVGASAIFDPESHHNLITMDLIKQTRLPTSQINIRWERKERAVQPTTYSAFVLIHLASAPMLPGVFLVTNERIPGGFDLLLGRPWMIGIEERYQNY